MTRAPGTASVLLLALLASLGAAAVADAAAYAPGELLVKYRASASRARRAATESALAMRPLETLSSIGVVRMRLADGADVEETARRLSADPAIEYAEPDYEIRVASVPNDSLFDRMWNLHNTG